MKTCVFVCVSVGFAFDCSNMYRNKYKKHTRNIANAILLQCVQFYDSCHFANSHSVFHSIISCVVYWIVTFPYGLWVKWASYYEILEKSILFVGNGNSQQVNWNQCCWLIKIVTEFVQVVVARSVHTTQSKYLGHLYSKSLAIASGQETEAANTTYVSINFYQFYIEWSQNLFKTVLIFFRKIQ